MHPYVMGYPTFVLMLPVGIAAGLGVSILAARRAGIPAWNLARGLALVVAVSLAGAKAMALAEDAIRGSSLRLDLATGYRYPGALVGLLLAVPLLRRALPRGVGVMTLLDVCVCGLGFAAGIMRANCFLAACCVGPPCSYPWCVSFSRGLPPELAAAHPVHPLHLYLMVNSLVATAVAFRVVGRRAFDGQAVWTYLALHEMGKAILEMWRMPPAPMVQLTSLGLGLLGTAMLLSNAWTRSARTDIGRSPHHHDSRMPVTAASACVPRSAR